MEEEDSAPLSPWSQPPSPTQAWSQVPEPWVQAPSTPPQLWEPPELGRSSSACQKKPHVPVKVMEKILSDVPLSSLACFRGVCLTFYSTIRSLPPTLPFPQDPLFFLFYSWPHRLYVVYHPFRDRWFFRNGLRFPTASSDSHFLITRDSLCRPESACLKDLVTVFYLFNPFSNVTTNIPLPTASSLRYHGLALTFLANSAFKIVATRTHPLAFETYDSAVGSWTRCWTFPHKLDHYVNAVFLDGLLYVLCREPARLLRVDLEAGVTSEVEAEIPLTCCRNMMVFQGRLFMAGWACREHNGSNIMRIEVWELVREEQIQWRLVNSMPDNLLREFCNGLDMLRCRICSCAGIICFYHCLSDCVLTFDVLRGMWMRAKVCPMPLSGRNSWIGCAVEPNSHVLRGKAINGNEGGE